MEARLLGRVFVLSVPLTTECNSVLAHSMLLLRMRQGRENTNPGNEVQIEGKRLSSLSLRLGSIKQRGFIGHGSNASSLDTL
jgi:hypothetical protein